jgi:hypothetical protein
MIVGDEEGRRDQQERRSGERIEIGGIGFELGSCRGGFEDVALEGAEK